ncbi:MAG: hypothetical protein GY938_27230 [Ketobacter sp.]|nr:hypothetical protein [Ketobacter sp.]
MYTIEATGQQVTSFTKAIEIADQISSDVLLNGQVKWTPATPVSKKRMRQYQGDLNAYNAYAKLVNK